MDLIARISEQYERDEVELRRKILDLGIALSERISQESLNAATENVYPGKMLLMQVAQHKDGGRRISVELVGKPLPGVPVKPLTDEEIADLRKLDAGATALPWEPSSNGEYVEARTVVGKKLDLQNVGYEGEMRREDVRLIAAARNALPRLLDFATAARALLKRIEWSGAEPDFHEDYAAACPVCREMKSPHAEHKPDCEMAALIGAK